MGAAEEPDTTPAQALSMRKLPVTECTGVGDNETLGVNVLAREVLRRACNLQRGPRTRRTMLEVGCAVRSKGQVWSWKYQPHGRSPLSPLGIGRSTQLFSAAAVRIDEFDENITFADLKVYPTMGNGDLNRKEEGEGRK